MLYITINQNEIIVEKNEKIYEQEDILSRSITGAEADMINRQRALEVMINNDAKEALQIDIERQALKDQKKQIEETILQSLTEKE
jgi:hypothetical protein